MALEEDNLFEKKKEAVELKKEFAKRNNVNETELEQFISDVLSFEDSGVSMLDDELNKTEWNLGESILFVVTTLTTIGRKLSFYGSVRLSYKSMRIDNSS